MATLSTAQTATATTLTPPSSSHGDANGFQWDFSATSGKPEVSLYPCSEAVYSVKEVTMICNMVSGHMVWTGRG